MRENLSKTFFRGSLHFCFSRLKSHNSKGLTHQQSLIWVGVGCIFATAAILSGFLLDVWPFLHEGGKKPFALKGTTMKNHLEQMWLKLRLMTIYHQTWYIATILGRDFFSSFRRAKRAILFHYLPNYPARLHVFFTTEGDNWRVSKTKASVAVLSKARCC